MSEGLEQKFSGIYRRREWTNGSGPGSFPQLNEPLLDYIDRFLVEKQVRSLVDIGCGDFQLWRSFDFGRCKYTGFDVVPELIKRNRSRFETSDIKFEEMPADLNALPEADVYFVKDVLIHLNNAISIDIVTTCCAKSDFALFVNNVAADGVEFNKEIEVGGFRPVDLSLGPFSRDVALAMRYGRVWNYDPSWPHPLARLFRRKVWPGEKHLQVVVGANVARFNSTVPTTAPDH